ncbi:MAG: hypothetical protein PHR35_08655 [Kiritimatiellae bacterium]|nr:hypothetical protein [Kiritimatiellia bacterium]
MRNKIRHAIGRWLDMVPSEQVAAERRQLQELAGEWRSRHDAMARGRISVTMKSTLLDVAHVQLRVSDVRDPREREYLLGMVVAELRRQARW